MYAVHNILSQAFNELFYCTEFIITSYLLHVLLFVLACSVKNNLYFHDIYLLIVVFIILHFGSTIHFSMIICDLNILQQPSKFYAYWIIILVNCLLVYEVNGRVKICYYYNILELNINIIFHINIKWKI